MFRFLKRVFKREPVSEAPVVTESVKAEQADRAEQQRQARQAALEQAIALAHDETAATAFILQSDYPDARRQAAQHLHSRACLEQVLQAMRNTDRRVARLMQQRLDALDQEEKRAAQADDAIAQAERLVQLPLLMVNQVTELDHAWRRIGDAPAPQRERFDASREQLRQRLQAQTELQRALLDAGTALTRLIEAAPAMPAAEASQQLETLEASIATHLASPEAGSLPKARVQAVQEQAAQLKAQLGKQLAAQAQREEALQARLAALDAWEAQAGQDAAQLDDAALRVTWQSLPGVSDAPELDQRFDALAATVRAARRPAEAERPAPASMKTPAPAPVSAQDQAEARAAMDAALGAMESALEEGSLQAAAEQDRALRAMDFKTMRPGEEALSRLSRLRAELARLQGWARWGGNVSREELLKAAQDLATQEMAVAERATKVGSLRERWKSLDASAGPASRDAWLRFDAACTEAYAPVAEHFRQLAEERRQNLDHAAALTAEVSAHAESLGLEGEPSAVDWKGVAAYVSRATQSWQKLGPIERRERKAAEAAFGAALDLLRKPLAAQQQREVARRESLIAEVEALDAGAPRVTDTLKAIQERWQEQARALPLSRADEQALWQRFRHACDALFAERKESARTLDAERQQHLERRQALCATLEAAVDAPVATLGQLLRDSAAAWREIGPVPRAAQQQIDDRYDAATAALRQRVDQARQAAADAQAALLQQKFALCRQAEQALVDGALDDARREALQEAWRALPALGGGNERIMAARFEAAIAGTDAGRDALHRNRDLVMEEILQMEIRLGVESPPELSQERLKQQIQVLQSSLRSGQRPVEPQQMLMQLCAQPALLDDAAAARVERLIRQAQS
ncbi:DUF349 domain-containing protein [Noviherbaspirillum suwonense]|uniref:DUF349 domain-containing protein n=1 Tax=Noviherbaspirillum suwonense TaxID=1224511 RepID=A0ABY1QRG0_9BURK|nr:DUF349 domain-containing protein [Noviherbaspirillum suwonense]SMP78168.1 protein of unknown function [Noviherbaspirillum suwonense]